MSAAGEITIRAARPGEAGVVLGFIRALAAYEKLEHEVEADEASLDAALFGPAPRVFCDLLEEDGEPVGFALWFYNFSTFLGRHGIWLEDLFVLPERRGRGHGRRLLAHLARRCRDEGLGRLEWWVLDWNEPSIAFYRSLGAVAMDEWTVMRTSGAALARLAEEAGEA